MPAMSSSAAAKMRRRQGGRRPRLRHGQDGALETTRANLIEEAGQPLPVKDTRRLHAIETIKILDIGQ